MKNAKMMNFEQKMKKFILNLSIKFMIATLLVSSVLFSFYIYNLTSELITSDIRAASHNIDRNLDFYHNLIYYVSLNDAIQDYYTFSNNDTSSQYKITNELRTFSNLTQDIHFIAIIDPSREAIYAGNNCLVFDADFEEQLLADYHQATTIKGNSMRILSNTHYYDTNDEICLFFPLYSTSTLNKQLGIICFNIKKSSIIPEFNTVDATLNYYLTHANGNLIDSSDTTLIPPVNLPYIEESIQNSTSTNPKLHFQPQSDGLYISCKVPNYHCYYTAKFDSWTLFKSVLTMPILTSILFALIAFLMLKSMQTIVAASYRPWTKVIEAMKSVIDKNLDTRIHFEDSDVDMATVSEGFNLMLDNINRLIKDYTLEQYKLAEAEFTILQSQIQPHFLYNTLECIHWQALSGETKTTSTMIKTLAHYYRSILSKGKNIITWEEELNLTLSYLKIQQMRYDDSLTYHIDCEACMHTLYLPKLTLQPLIENAIYHGIKSTDHPQGTITIRGYQTLEGIAIQIIDNGTSMTATLIDKINASLAQNDETFGFGIRNVHYRLQHHFGNHFTIKYALNADGGTTVTISLSPLQNNESIQGA